MSSKRPPFEARPRPLTRDEAAVAAALIQEPVTPSWLGLRGASGTLEVLRPPMLTKGARRRGGASDLTQWTAFTTPGLDDQALFAATLRGSQRWKQRQR